MAVLDREKGMGATVHPSRGGMLVAKTSGGKATYWGRRRTRGGATNCPTPRPQTHVDGVPPPSDAAPPPLLAPFSGRLGGRPHIHVSVVAVQWGHRPPPPPPDSPRHWHRGGGIWSVWRRDGLEKRRRQQGGGCWRKPPGGRGRPVAHSNAERKMTKKKSNVVGRCRSSRGRRIGSPWLRIERRVVG